MNDAADPNETQQEQPPEKPAKIDRQRAFVDAVTPLLLDGLAEPICKVMAEEMRAQGMTGIFDRPTTKYVCDLRKERTILATMFEDVPAPDGLEPAHFWAPFHQHIYRFLRERPQGQGGPTIEEAAAYLSERGFRARWLADAIQNIVGVPASIPLDHYALDLIKLSWHRRALERIERAEALIRLVRLDAIHETEVAAELRAAVEAFAGVEEGT